MHAGSSGTQVSTYLCAQIVEAVVEYPRKLERTAATMASLLRMRLYVFLQCSKTLPMLLRSSYSLNDDVGITERLEELTPDLASAFYTLLGDYSISNQDFSTSILVSRVRGGTSKSYLLRSGYSLLRPETHVSNLMSTYWRFKMRCIMIVDFHRYGS